MIRDLLVQMIRGLTEGRGRNDKVRLSRFSHKAETCFSPYPPWWHFIGFDSCRSLVQDFSGKIPRELGLSKLPNMQHLQIIINRCLHFHSLWMLLRGDFVIQGGRGKCGLSSFTPPSVSFPSQLTAALSLGCSHQNPQGVLDSSPLFMPQVQSISNICLLCLRNICRNDSPRHLVTAPAISHLDQCSCLFLRLQASAFLSLCPHGQGETENNWVGSRLSSIQNPSWLPHHSG